MAPTLPTEVSKESGVSVKLENGPTDFERQGIGYM